MVLHAASRPRSLRREIAALVQNISARFARHRVARSTNCDWCKTSHRCVRLYGGASGPEAGSLATGLARFGNRSFVSVGSSDSAYGWHFRAGRSGYLHLASRLCILLLELDQFRSNRNRTRNCAVRPGRDLPRCLPLWPAQDRHPSRRQVIGCSCFDFQDCTVLFLIV